MSIKKSEINAYLDKNGFKHANLGYKYLLRAIEICSQDESYLNNVTKRLYPTIAKEFDTLPARAERAIRHAIETCSTYAHGKMPTNSEFIAKAVDDFRYGGEI